MSALANRIAAKHALRTVVRISTKSLFSQRPQAYAVDVANCK
jgi:hypothetical protein